MKDQLQELDAQSTVFLPHVATLVIDIDGERRIVERVVDSDVEFSNCQQIRQQLLLVGRSGPAPDDNTTRQFQIWTRIVGGDDDPEQAKRICAIVKHLPNRWPEVRQVAVGIAVEEASEPQQGVFVIFLPTEMTTGTGAHINAPFYGSLDRRQINFNDHYNELLLESVFDLCLDVVIGLVSGQPEDWRAQAVIDILSSTASVGGKDWCFMDRLYKRASERNSALDDQALILCDSGWCVPGKARMMPCISDNSPICAERWREHTKFAVVSTMLDERKDAVRKLLDKLDGSSTPTHCEWQRMIEQVATKVQAHVIDVTWDAFLNSLIAVLPANLKSEPKGSDPDQLAATKFLPGQDGRLLSASDTTKLFFQPVRGADDAADFVGEVPNSLKQRIAFLHQDVRTQEQEEGQRHRRTAVQKFLDGRFVRSFRREELLRDVVLAAMPPLPAPHGSPEADICSELFAWTLKLLGKDEPDTLLPLLKRLPVACHGGWLVMSDAVFGPGWPGRLGNDVWLLAKDLPEDMAMRLCKVALLPPNDPCWGVTVEDRNELFARVGVVDGFRLQKAPEVRFHMREYSYKLPSTAPTGTPQTA